MNKVWYGRCRDNDVKSDPEMMCSRNWHTGLRLSMMEGLR
jgi:hypothetical protein